MLIKKRWFKSLRASLLVAFSATALALGAVTVSFNASKAASFYADGWSTSDLQIRVSPSWSDLAANRPTNVGYVSNFDASAFEGLGGPQIQFGSLLVVDVIDGDPEDNWKGATWQYYRVAGALTDFSWLSRCGSWVYLSEYDLDGAANKNFVVNNVVIGNRGYWYYHNNSKKPNLFGSGFGGYANAYYEYGVDDEYGYGVVDRLVFPYTSSTVGLYVDDYDPITDTYSQDGIEHYLSGWASYLWNGMLLDPIDGTYEAGYSAGYTDGYRLGKEDGKTIGYNDGYTDGRASVTSGGATMNTIFGAVIGVPFSVLNGLSAFTVWDTAIVSILLTLCMVSIAIWVIKKVFL